MVVMMRQWLYHDDDYDGITFASTVCLFFLSCFPHFLAERAWENPHLNCVKALLPTIHYRPHKSRVNLVPFLNWCLVDIKVFLVTWLTDWGCFWGPLQSCNTCFPCISIFTLPWPTPLNCIVPSQSTSTKWFLDSWLEGYAAAFMFMHLPSSRLPSHHGNHKKGPKEPQTAQNDAEFAQKSDGFQHWHVWKRCYRTTDTNPYKFVGRSGA